MLTFTLLLRSRHSGNVTMCAAESPHEPFTLLIINAHDDRSLVRASPQQGTRPRVVIRFARDGYPGTVPRSGEGGCGGILMLIFPNIADYPWLIGGIPGKRQMEECSVPGSMRPDEGHSCLAPQTSLRVGTKVCVEFIYHSVMVQNGKVRGA